jgi:hypothetical protein
MVFPRLMFCSNPECPDYEATGFHAEYVVGVTVCPACGEFLVDRLPDEAAAANGGVPASSTGGDAELVEVHSTSDPSEIPIVKSLFEAAGIPCLTRGEEGFDSFRGSRSAFRYNPRAGAIVFLVPAALADDAHALLQQFDEED